MGTGTTGEKENPETVTAVNPYEETFKRMETRIHEAFKQHQERINGLQNLLVQSRKKPQNLDKNSPFIVILDVVDATVAEIFGELKESYRLIENTALANLSTVREGANNRELMRQLAFQMIEIASRDEKLKELEQKIRQMVIDADTKYAGAIAFLEKVNKNLDDQE